MSTTKEKIAVMQAHLAGKTIEFRTYADPDWLVAPPNPTWNWQNYEYRVKQEPKVVYVNEYVFGQPTTYTSEVAAKEAAKRHRGASRVAVKYIEVIEDEQH